VKGEIPPAEFFRRYPAPEEPGPRSPFQKSEWKFYFFLSVVLLAWLTYEHGFLYALLATPLMILFTFLRDSIRYDIFRPRRRRSPAQPQSPPPSPPTT
jgi:hypothetical protein